MVRFESSSSLLFGRRDSFLDCGLGVFHCLFWFYKLSSDRATDSGGFGHLIPYMCGIASNLLPSEESG
jgi:hypothetical protein